MNDPPKETKTPPAATAKRVRHGRVWYAALHAVIALFALLLVLMIWIVHRATQKITINRATTFVTGPLRHDGTINYAAALNKIAGRGVTPQNNAAIPLLRVFGVGKGTMGKHWRQRAKLLGMGGAARRSHFQYAYQYFKKHPKEKAAMVRAGHQYFMDDSELVLHHVWTIKQYPLVAKYVHSQRGALAAIRQAVMRPRYFFPAAEHGKHSRILVGSFIGPLAEMREATDLLLEHAMLMIGERHYRRVAKDVLAVRRMAQLTSQQPFLISNLMAMSDEALASNAEIRVALAHPNDVDLFRRLLYLSYSKAHSMRMAYDIGDRLSLLSVLQAMRGGDGAGSYYRVSTLKWFINWNWLFQRFNGLYSACSRGAGAPDYAGWARISGPAIHSVDANIRDVKHHWLHEPSTIVFGRLAPLLIVGLHKTVYLSFSESTADHFAKIVMALDLYRADHHGFPPTLAALCPKYLPHIGADTFTGEPPIYGRTANGYILRSAGPFGHLLQRPYAAIAERLLIRFPPFTKLDGQHLQLGATVDGLHKMPGKDYYGLGR